MPSVTEKSNHPLTLVTTIQHSKDIVQTQLACSYFLFLAALLFQESLHHPRTPCSCGFLRFNWGSHSTKANCISRLKRNMKCLDVLQLASYSGSELWKPGVVSLCIAAEAAIQCTRAFKDIFHFLFSMIMSLCSVNLHSSANVTVVRACE